MGLGRALTFGALLVAGCAAQKQQTGDESVAHGAAHPVNGEAEMDACRGAMDRVRGERGNAAKILTGQEDLGDPVLCDAVVASKVAVFRLLDAAGIICSDLLVQTVFEKGLVAEIDAVSAFAAAVDKMCPLED